MSLKTLSSNFQKIDYLPLHRPRNQKGEKERNESERYRDIVRHRALDDKDARGADLRPLRLGPQRVVGRVGFEIVSVDAESGRPGKLLVVGRFEAFGAIV